MTVPNTIQLKQAKKLLEQNGFYVCSTDELAILLRQTRNDAQEELVQALFKRLDELGERRG